MLSIVRGAPMHQYDENSRQGSTFEDLPYKFAVPVRSSPSSPVRETLFENVTPHKNLMANLRRQLEPVHYEFDQFSKDLDDTLEKLGDLQVMAEENEEEMDELGKQWVRVSQGINQLRESLTSTQWFLENTFHDYGWANQHEQQYKGEKDEGQDMHSISSTEKNEITSEASALQALKQLQLEMVQVG
ncbi:hypothetical protein BC937DRAFT_88279 [Endogone sp. FLAS-F59071]|nr:hypothetical protein BC937DRAFT_88279 [Endogone sp. FLAS-F59071]|eukprot:RUS23316.1 hypothetical protein BC937DRAFT_88279 [Endogone sp. FLAS-F59071]